MNLASHAWSVAVLAVVPEHVGSSGPPWRLSAVEGSSVPRRTPDEASRVTRRSAGVAGGRLAERVVVEGWTLTAAAEAAGVSVRCARKWVGRYRLDGEPGLVDRSSAPRRVANRTPPDRVEVIVAAAAAADDGGRDRRDARDAALDRLGDPDPDRDGPARPDRARAAGPLRALAAGRARPRRRQEARPDRGRRRQARPRRHRSTTTARAPTPTASAATPSAGSTSTSPSTTTAASPTPRCSPTRKPTTAARLPPPSRRLLPPPRHHRRTRPHRQRQPPTVAIVHALACRPLGIRHLRTRPYRPQTNGKAERFIRTLLNGWAYGAIYRSSHERTARP